MSSFLLPKASIAALATPTYSFPGLHVLVVEDQAETAESLAFILREAGHSVRVAADEETALQSAQEEPPDVVVIDLDLEGLTCYEVAQALGVQSRPKRPLLITVSGREPDTTAGWRPRAAWNDLHLSRPEAVDFLLRLLRRFQATLGPPCVLSACG